ncbi:IPT/TIG domain-containing protein [Mucilaginibacter sp.]|uniref:NHL domain-containing protein n=1 Tax=Mucilaginibacter sp. TaxID=1882438 RepID=UPI00283D461B|nr:IPT/TIG domain-containing protein [Mucilaginibacter sp.]MDR3694613.1 IPT/TIG domain-containing protein [Mucilaginibacter sp.]
MNLFSKSSYSAALFLAACLFGSCSKKNSPNPANTQLTIASLSTDHGPFNSVVTINGTGFSNTPSNDVVSFNGKAATVTAATSTQITAMVPVGAGTGKISLSVNGVNVTGPTFTYELTATVTTLAGNMSPGKKDGTGANASFNDPYAIAADAAGNIYVVDMGNQLIRKVTPAGVVTTLAGSGSPGANNGTGTSASFNYPSGITVDAAGNVYVADTDNKLIRKITPTGVVTTLAGSGTSGSTDGTGAAASFQDPLGLTIDNVGNIYAVDGNSLRMITPAGVVSTLGGPFDEPLGVVYFNGNLFFSDADKNTINQFKESAATVIAGSGSKGAINGTGLAASFSFPSGITADPSGNIYVTDTNNGLIRMITPGGVVTTLAGGATGVFAEIDGVGTGAGFDAPSGITIDSAGNLYVSDANGNEIRKIVLK